MNWSGKHALVTGGAGFIGSHVADALLARGARVTVYDNFSTGFHEFVPKHERARLVEADLLDAARVVDAMKGVDFVFHMAANAVDAMKGVDFVFHMAANADIKENFSAPRKCIEQNVVATQNVLEAMRAAGTK